MLTCPISRGRFCSTVRLLSTPGSSQKGVLRVTRRLLSTGRHAHWIRAQASTPLLCFRHVYVLADNSVNAFGRVSKITQGAIDKVLDIATDTHHSKFALMTDAIPPRQRQQIQLHQRDSDTRVLSPWTSHRDSRVDYADEGPSSQDSTNGLLLFVAVEPGHGSRYSDVANTQKLHRFDSDRTAFLRGRYYSECISSGHWCEYKHGTEAKAADC